MAEEEPVDPMIQMWLDGDLDENSEEVRRALAESPQLREEWAEVRALLGDLDRAGELRHAVERDVSRDRDPLRVDVHRAIVGRDRHPRRGRWLALAGVGLLFIGGWFVADALRTSVKDPDVLGSEVEPLRPIGDVRGDLTFEWKAVGGAEYYVVTVSLGSEERARSPRVDLTRWTPTGPVRERCEAGDRWVVRAFDAQGLEVGLSEEAAFRYLGRE
ncbi:MAG: hypothetical protein KDC38_07390 [Planctomycetes bacterium]|nr:hypothetical protein [Planctomycetota bacterium]